MGIFSKKSISTEAAQQPQPKNNAMADAMPQEASQKIVQEAGAKSAAEQAQGKLAQNLKPSSPAAVPEPQDKPIEEIKPSNYYTKYGNYNWDSNDGDFWKNAKESGLSLRDAINYYNKWQEDNNGKPLDMFEQYALLKRYDPFRSMKEQDEEDERLKRQQKWEKISNVFNHLANLWGTVRGANPAQQIESGTDLTKRQQEAVDRVRALRKAAGQDYIDALAAKRADEFKQRQMENEAKRLAEQQRYHDAVLAGQVAERARREKEGQGKLDQGQQKINQGQQKIDNTKEYQNKKLAIDKQRANNQSASVRLNQKKYNDQKDFTEVTEVKSNPTGTEKKTTKTRVRNPKQAAGNINKAKGGYSKAAELTRKLQGRK